MRTEVSIEIDRPIDEVFDYTIDHVAEWSMTVVEDELIEDKPGRVGSTFRCLTEDNGQQMEFTGTVTRHQPPHLSAVFLVGKSFDLDIEYEFENLAGRTRLTQRSRVIGKGFTRVILFLIGWMMKGSSCRASTKELSNLKRILEQRDGQSPV